MLGRFEVAAYKAKLQTAVGAAYPEFFGYKYVTGKQARKLGGNSDLLIYFYLYGLSLLNPQGSFCFITSNSWLDVEYGAGLQEFLLKYSRVRLVLDNKAKRSFDRAAVNTIIVLLSALAKHAVSEAERLDRRARFVMFKMPFEVALSCIVWQEIDSATEQMERPEFRAIVKDQQHLLQEGTEPAAVGTVQQKFEGDKWGGKYLRAPDVFWTILKRGQGKLTRLGNIVNVRFGIKTGANDFFYVRVLQVVDGIAHIRCDDGSQHTIEAEYVTEPALVKAREIVRPRVLPSDLAYRLVQLDEAASTKPHAKAFIEWGEASRKDGKGNEIGQFHRRPTTAGRRLWYAIRVQNYATVAFPMAHKRRAVIAALYGSDIHIDNRLYGVYPNEIAHGPLIAASLVSTFSTLCREIYGRANFGEGLLDMKVYEAEDMPTLDPAAIASPELLVQTFESLAGRTIQILYDELRQADRKILDDTFLALIGFTDPAERAEVLAELQDAARRTVWARQAKAGKTREARQTYDDWIASGLPFGNVDEDV